LYLYLYILSLHRLQYNILNLCKSFLFFNLKRYFFLSVKKPIVLTFRVLLQLLVQDCGECSSPDSIVLSDTSILTLIIKDINDLIPKVEVDSSVRNGVLKNDLDKRNTVPLNTLRLLASMKMILKDGQLTVQVSVRKASSFQTLQFLHQTLI